MDQEVYPRDKETLLREMDARMRLSDIKRLHALHHRMAPSWWEPVFVILLFAAALGLLASLHQYVAARDRLVERLTDPQNAEIDKWILFSELQNRPLNKWMLFWFGLTILMTIMCFQIILFRIYNFRRMSDVLMRSVEDARNRMDRLEAQVEEVVQGRVQSKIKKPTPPNA
jgi:hypothetical protein